MTLEAFEEVVRRALDELRVADQVTLIGVATAPDSGAMTAELRVATGIATAAATATAAPAAAGSGTSAGAGAGATVAISVAPAADAAADEARVASETRAELRRALRMCPLCQRIGHVEKRRGATGQQEGCIVRCPGCGEFEIDQDLIRRFRSAWERHDASVLDRLPSLSERTRASAGASEHLRITANNWQNQDS